MESISYIIPHYENIKGVIRLLESIELHNSDEIIVIDDCSSDETFKELKKYEHRFNIKILTTSINGGAGKARNIGLKNARNKWGLFADSDDYFVEGYYRNLSCYLENNNLDIIYFSPTSIIESCNKSVRNDRHSYYSFLVKNFKDSSQNSINDLKYKMVVPWSKLVNLDYVKEKSIFFDEVKLSNDVMFSVKTAYHTNKITASEKIIYCCVESESSLTSDIKFEKTMMRLDIFESFYHYLKNNLEKKEFKTLGINGLSFLVLGLRNKYDFFQLKEIFYRLKKSKIPILTIRYIFDMAQRKIKK